MVKLFFLISGENKTLPLAELIAILEAEKHNFSIIEKLDQVIRLKSEINCIKSVYLRSAYTRVCAFELFTCELNDKKIIKYMNKIDFSSVINENESFAVRIKRVRNYAEKSAVMDLERKIGRIILQNTKNTKVNLTLPDKIFVGILTSGKMVFGLKIAAICPKPFGERRPRKKPFFHPSAMPSKLARCMINLAHAKQNDLVLDPFCGTGSTLIEATLIGCRTLGLDAQLKMLKGCKKNLEYFNIKPEGLILADARKHPINKTNCVVTDPPYGRCCSTMNSTTKKIVEKVLFSVLSILNKDDRICIASPKSIRLSLVGKTVGYDHLESHFVYVHRSLTREIAVFKKNKVKKMSMNIIFLGTAGSIPTIDRSLSAIILKRQNEQIMFDCGEGTQRQMLKAKTGFHKKMKILISHLHGDHVLGLPGLLQTMALMDRQKKIEIYGPVGIKKFMDCSKEILKFGLTFSVDIVEVVNSGIVCEEKEYFIEAIKSSHSETSLSYGFIEKPRPGKFFPEKATALKIPESKFWSSLQHGKDIELTDGRIIKALEVTGPLRKGRKIIYSGDTRPFITFEKFAYKADLIIYESTFDDALIEKAKIDGHSTPSQAAKEAKKAKAKKLLLTHISARYPDSNILVKQAQKIFKNTIVAKDFMEIELPLSEN